MSLRVTVLELQNHLLFQWSVVKIMSTPFVLGCQHHTQGGERFFCPNCPVWSVCPLLWTSAPSNTSRLSAQSSFPPKWTKPNPTRAVKFLPCSSHRPWCGRNTKPVRKQHLRLIKELINSWFIPLEGLQTSPHYSYNCSQEVPEVD